jgi:hypothetical protein
MLADADHKLLGQGTAGLTRRHRHNHPLPLVQRIGPSQHTGLPESNSRRFRNLPIQSK